jgi:hypothetical protein
MNSILLSAVLSFLLLDIFYFGSIYFLSALLQTPQFRTYKDLTMGVECYVFFRESYLTNPKMASKDG